jgi:prolyl oligopeptidase PreP (S9A serine peptidase family)
VAEVGIEQEADKIEDAKTEETLDWIEEEERKEREATEAAKKAQLDKDEQWMIEQLKKQSGDNFGEDIDLNFGE